MGKPLMIQEHDDRRIEALKKRLQARTKVEVVRAGLDLLERDAERKARIARWRRAAQLAARTSRVVTKEFKAYARLGRL